MPKQTEKVCFQFSLRRSRTVRDSRNFQLAQNICDSCGNLYGNLVRRGRLTVSIFPSRPHHHDMRLRRSSCKKQDQTPAIFSSEFTRVSILQNFERSEAARPTRSAFKTSARLRVRKPRKSKAAGFFRNLRLIGAAGETTARARPAHDAAGGTALHLWQRQKRLHDRLERRFSKTH